MEGMSNRMGKVHLPNIAFSTPLLLRFLESIEERIENSSDSSSLHDWIIMACYGVVAYTLSLRGDEGFLIYLKSTVENWTSPSKKYIIISLLGQLKGEKGDSVHLFPVVNVTKSGVRVREIVKRALSYKKKLGFSDGPLI